MSEIPLYILHNSSVNAQSYNFSSPVTLNRPKFLSPSQVNYFTPCRSTIPTSRLEDQKLSKWTCH